MSQKTIALQKKYIQEMENYTNSSELEDGLTREIEDEAMAKWEELANITLGDSAENYINSMRSERDGTNVVLSLDGDLANMQEKGAAPYDMKPGLLDGKDSVVIPIASSAPGKRANGRTGPNPLSKGVYAKVKKQVMKVGDRFSGNKRRSRSYDKSYLHKSPKYAGLTKSNRFYAKRTGAEFVTFRTVSKKSDPSSFWHPGFEAIDLMSKVKDYIRQITPEIFSNFFSGEDF
jgi:hypothetical protein